jgi:hypothetical protein
MKYLEVFGEVKDHYNKKYVTSEISEEIRRWKDIPCLLFGRINIVKMAILQKAIKMLNAIPIKILMTDFLKFIWKLKDL